jgi:hypothetical protein
MHNFAMTIGLNGLEQVERTLELFEVTALWTERHECGDTAAELAS